MVEACCQFSLFNSIAAGFTAGLSVSIVVGIYTKSHNWFQRRDQIKYLRNVILGGMNRIYSAEDTGTIYAPGLDVSISPDQTRHAYYEEMRRTLAATLHSRASEIKPEEILELNDTLHILNWLIDAGRLAPKEQYYRTFVDIKALKWLGIKG